MAATTPGIPRDILEEIEQTYLSKTLEELPKSPPIPKAILDAIPRKTLDLPYGSDNPEQTIDLYLPPEAGTQAPVHLVIFIHGGGWIGGDKRDMQVSVYFDVLNHGYALASINYWLSPGARFPEPVKDCKAAVRYLKAHAHEYGIDPARVAVVGNSAGAYYALMIACSPHIDMLEDVSTGNHAYGTEVRCCIATYPPTALDLIATQRAQEKLAGDLSDPNMPENLFLGAKITDLPQSSLRAASPIAYVTRQIPPLMVKAGSADTLVPYTQAVCFANRVKEIAGPSRIDFEIVPGAGHHDPAFKNPAFLAEALAFLDRYMKEPI